MALTITAVALLYIAFAFENNVSFMLRPASWRVYFESAGGRRLALGSILSAFNGKLRLTLGFLLTTVVVTVLMRTLLRHAYLDRVFRVEDLAVSPQAFVLAVHPRASARCLLQHYG